MLTVSNSDNPNAWKVNEKIVGFLRRWGLSIRPKCVSFLLTHVIKGQNVAIVATYPLDAEKDLEDTVQGIAAEIEEASSSHVKAHNKSQQYCIQALGEQSGHVIAQHLFRLSPPPENVDSDETESPTQSGALAQSMRLTESFARMAIMSMSTVMSASENQARRLLERNEKLEKLLEEEREVIDKIIDRRNEIGVEMQQTIRSEDRKDRLIGRIEQVVIPAVLERISGITPFEELAKTLSPEQFTGILSLLRDDQKMLVAKLSDAAANLEDMREGKSTQLAKDKSNGGS